MQRIPLRGELSVSVPGVVDGWSELLSKHGTRTLAQALEPAIKYARDGYAVSEIIAGQWKEVESVLARDPKAAAIFLPGGKAPAPGDVFKNPALAASLELIAKGGRDVFYKGAIAKAIADDMQRRNGLITAKDLADHHADWVDPVSTTYRGYQVLELPPNTQGVAALEMLNIMEGFDLKSLGHNTAAYLHTMVEAKRIAFADRGAWLGDASTTPAKAVERMLSKDYAAERRKEINPDKAAAGYKALAIDGRTTPDGGDDPIGRGDTVYLTAADSEGNVISLIQSLYETFGSGIVAGDTGIVLHNRGNLFNLIARPPEPDRAGQAAVPHADPGDGDEGRHAVAVVRRDGGRHAGAGARAGAREPDRLRDEHPGSGRSAALPRQRRRPRARVRLLRRRARRPDLARPQIDHQHRRVGRLPGDPDRPEDPRADGRIGPAQRRDGRGLVIAASRPSLA